MPQVARPRRYPIVTKVLWRRCGETEWLAAMCVNASRSGVFFETDQVVPVGTEVELILELSWETGMQVQVPDVADLICEGRVVRSAESGPGGAVALAATINKYSFIRQP
jgi:hypothetical protein